MDVLQMKYFCAIVERGSISAAAQSMFLTQPALSKSIQKLESELGAKLFNRRKKRLVLNEAGKKAYRHFSAVLRELDALDHSLESYRALPPKITVFSSVLFFSEYLLPEYDMLFPGKIEGVNCAEAELHTDTLHEHRAALLLSARPIDGKDVVSKLLFYGKLLVRSPIDGEFSNVEKITVEDLRGQPIQIGVLDSAITAHIRELLIKHNIPIPEETLKGQSMRYNSRFQAYHIRNTNSLCFTTDTVASYLEMPGYRLLDIDDPDAKIPYYATYLRQNVSAVAPLLDWLGQRVASAR